MPINVPTDDGPSFSDLILNTLKLAESAGWTERQLATAIHGISAAVAGPIGQDGSELATLPLWTSGRRPKWWGDAEVRDFLTALHRQATLDGALSACCERYGATRTPGRSSLNRFWMNLDAARGWRS